jgi:hypothetical protein
MIARTLPHEWRTIRAFGASWRAASIHLRWYGLQNSQHAGS